MLKNILQVGLSAEAVKVIIEVKFAPIKSNI
jgi:hypothetical protein